MSEASRTTGSWDPVAYIEQLRESRAQWRIFAIVEFVALVFIAAVLA